MCVQCYNTDKKDVDKFIDTDYSGDGALVWCVFSVTTVTKDVDKFIDTDYKVQQ